MLPGYTTQSAAGCDRCCNSCSSRIQAVCVKIAKQRGTALGIALRMSSTGRCIVSRIMHGGLIHKTGIMNAGDELLEINGCPVLGRSIECIQQHLVSLDGEAILRLARTTKGQRPMRNMYVRAMLDYNPTEDNDLPCPELGLHFKTADILEIVDSTDFTWWQARHWDSKTSQQTKLIPSADLLENRLGEAITNTQEQCNLSHNSRSRSFANLLITNIRSKVSSKSTSRLPTPGFSCSNEKKNCDLSDAALVTVERRIMRWMPFRLRSGRGRSHFLENFIHSPVALSRSTESIGENLDEHLLARSSSKPAANAILNGCICESESNSTVAKNLRSKSSSWKNFPPFIFADLPIQPYEEMTCVPKFRYRSLVLLGAPGVGRRAIRRSLIVARPDLFANPVPHTTRKPNENEIDGVHFHFVQQHEMASDIANKEFLEYGQRNNVLYGISLESVRRVVASSRLAVLDVEPSTLRILRTAEFAPIVIFVSPPNFDILTKNSSYDMLKESLQRLSKESGIMEYIYRPYINSYVVNHNTDDSMRQISEYVVRLQSGKQWVPTTWTM